MASNYLPSDFSIENYAKASNYLLEKLRLASFKDWPFTENCNCTPEKLAEAGFYSCPEDNSPDLVRCFVCFITLDGWEPDDDPWKEHVSHEKQPCEFLKLGKKESEQTLEEWLYMKLHQTITLERFKLKSEIEQRDRSRDKFIEEHEKCFTKKR